MATYRLPTLAGGSQTIDANSLAEAESKAQAAGWWSASAGSYGGNSLVSGGSSGGSSSSGGGAPAPSTPAASSGAGGFQYKSGQHDYTQDQLQAARDAAQKEYQQWLMRTGDERLAFEKATEASHQALSALDLSAKLQGPRNAFTQQAVNYGLNQAGFSPLAGALAGQYRLPTFQAPQMAPQAANLQTLAADMQNGTGFGQISTGSVQGGGTTNGTMQPAAGGSNPGMDAQTQQFLQSLPNPNQIVPGQWNALPTDTQQFLLGAYGAKGFSANDVTDAVKASAPVFKAPGVGLASV